MKKISIALMAASMVLVACHKKSVPAATATADKSAGATAAAKSDKPDEAYLLEGKAVYESKCHRCHALKKTDNFTQQRWVGILNSMAPKARLTDDEKAKVLAFVQSKAKDATSAN